MDQKFGLELLMEQALAAAWADISIHASHHWFMHQDVSSPIERLFISALTLRCHWDNQKMWGWKVTNVEDGKISEARSRDDYHSLLIVQKQVKIQALGRVDFVIHAYADWAREENAPPAGWRQLIVECDGHDFHERTKEQAANDKSRDRAATLAGVEVFRFTGSELWRDPWGCAGQVIEWADKGI